MRFFQKPEFETKYKKILKREITDAGYVDPDGTYKENKEMSFYKLLEIFMNKREKECDFITDKWKYKHIEEYNGRRGGILINEKDICLTSDQFGFSAHERIYSKSKSEKYPLPRYIYLCDQKKEKIDYDFIIDYVKNTRTIGGSFIWPLALGEKYESVYNKIRGVRNDKSNDNEYQGYLEDCVDLTLLEIKHALDGDYDRENPEFTTDILYSEYKKDSSHIKEWLNHFGSFKNYIEYFMLEDFVIKVDGDYMPKDITTGKPLIENDVKEYKEEFVKNKIGNLQKIKDSKELYNILNFVEQKIISRSGKMEEYIFKEEK